jgi:hypothetical protein
LHRLLELFLIAVSRLLELDVEFALGNFVVSRPLLLFRQDSLGPFGVLCGCIPHHVPKGAA